MVVGTLKISLDRLKKKQRALTGMRNLPFVLQCHRKGISMVAVCGTEL